MAGSPTKPGNWGDWATIHGAGIYESEYDQTQVSKTQENEHSIKHIPCIYAKISGSSWRVCTCAESKQYKNYCRSKCVCFKENASETVINSPPKKNNGHGDWDAFDLPRLQSNHKKEKKKNPRKSARKNNRQMKTAKASTNVAKQDLTLYHGFIGATVTHKTFGTGKVVGVTNNSFLIDFDNNKLTFDFSELFNQEFTFKK